MYCIVLDECMRVLISLYLFQKNMCWIYGYMGDATNTHQILLRWLNRLEYRGYDSAGILVGYGSEQKIVKSVGKVSALTNKVSSLIAESDVYTYGIAHTRWATHGGVTEENTHPHTSTESDIAVVHNGIIENYAKLKKWLIEKWYTFYSETDSEVIAKLLEDNRDGELLSTVEKTLPMLSGAYALLITHKESPRSMVWVRLGSPLLFGRNKDGIYFSSDAQALAWVVDEILHLEDGELAHIHEWNYSIRAQGKNIFRNLEVFDEKDLLVSKWDYDHFMIKEVDEQPAVFKRILKWRVNIEDMTLHADAFHGMQNENYKKIVFVACGTSYYAAFLGSYRIKQIAWIHCDVEIASEMQYLPLDVNDETLYIFVSQSWETADTLEVLKSVRDKWGNTFWIVNVVGSSISRMTDFGLFTRAGAEIGVASTKAFVAQTACIFLLSLFLWSRRNLTKWRHDQLLQWFLEIPDLMEEIFEQKKHIQSIGEELSKYTDIFYLGRWYQVPIAFEWSLKMKEISYIHSEAYPAGELKHGPLALIDENVPIIFLHPKDMVFHHNTSSLQEVKARKWLICEVWGDGEDADWHIPLPDTLDELSPFLTVVVTQLLAYYCAKRLGRDIDKPRNLAKSVTVK